MAAATAVASIWLFAPAAVAAAPVDPAVNWPQWHFSADHRGFNPSETILGPTTVAGLTRKWSALTFAGTLQAPVVVGDDVYVGVVYALGGGGRLYDLDANTGAVRWQSFSTQDGFAGAPAVANGLVYAIDDYPGTLYAFNRLDGSVAWSQPIARNGGFQADPTVADGKVFVNGPDFPGTLYAFDAISGATVWAAPASDALTGAPAVSQGMVFDTGLEGSVFAFDESDGSPVWAAPTGGAFLSSPTVADGKVFTGGSDGHMYAFDAFTGATIWTSAGGRQGYEFTLAAVAYNTVYVGSFAGHFYAINESTGKRRWQIDVPRGYYFNGPPAVANGVVYEGEAGVLVFSAYDARTGAVLWTADTEVNTSPVVVNGRVFVSGIDSVEAFGLPASR